MPGLTKGQVSQLIQPIKPSRVLQAHGQSHVPSFDVAAHLTRIFGFGGWDTEDCQYRMVFEDGGAEGKRWTVGYTASIRLVIKDPEGNEVAHFENGAGGDAVNQPSRGDAHHLAMTTAISTALKRCAAFGLGDQFGLSLYNKGSETALIKKVIVGPLGEAGDVQEAAQVPKSLGNDEREGAEPGGEASPPASSEITEMQRRIREHPKYKLMDSTAKGAFLSATLGWAVTSLREIGDDDCDMVLAALGRQA